MNVVVLLGAPGAGKGTQAPLLSERLGIPVVATGDLFRAAVRDGTTLGMDARRYMDAGQLVPDEIVVRLLLERLSRPDAGHGVILDGFPRTAVQAKALDDALADRTEKVTAAVLIDIHGDELIRLDGTAADFGLTLLAAGDQGQQPEGEADSSGEAGYVRGVDAVMAEVGNA